MLEYPVDEAQELLRKNFEGAKLNLTQIEEDLDFLKEQITTMEVSILLFEKPKIYRTLFASIIISLTPITDIARVYNYEVKLRKQQQPQDE